MTIELKADETLDDLLHGELKLIQHRDGFRYSADALLIAHFCLPLVASEVVLDMGAGAGVIALILAARGRPARVIGVEVQKGLAGLAKRNCALNRTDPQVEIICQDATQLCLELMPRSIGVIVTNPPFRTIDSGHVSVNPEKAIARHELAMSLPVWLSEAKKLLSEDGKLCIIYPYDQEPRLLRAVEDQRFQIARRQYALDRPGGENKLIMLELRLGPCQYRDLPPVPIETDQGKFSLDGYK